MNNRFRLFLDIVVVSISVLWAGASLAVQNCNLFASKLSKEDIKVIAEVASSLSAVQASEHSIVNSQILRIVRSRLRERIDPEKINDAEFQVMRILSLKTSTKYQTEAKPSDNGAKQEKSANSQIMGDFKLVDVEPYYSKEYSLQKYESNRKDSLLHDTAYINGDKFELLNGGFYTFDRKLEILLTGRGLIRTIRILNSNELVIFFNSYIILARIDGNKLSHKEDVLLDSELSLPDPVRSFPHSYLRISDRKIVIFNEDSPLLLDLDKLNRAPAEKYFQFQKWELDDLNSTKPKNYSGGQMITNKEGVLLSRTGDIDFFRVTNQGGIELLAEFKMEDLSFLKQRLFYHKMSSTNFKLFYVSNSTSAIEFIHFDIAKKTKTKGSLSYEGLDLVSEKRTSENYLESIIVTESNLLVGGFKWGRYLLVWDLKGIKEGTHRYKKNLLDDFENTISLYIDKWSDWRLEDLYSLSDNTFGAHFAELKSERVYLEFKQDQLNVDEL